MRRVLLFLALLACVVVATPQRAEVTRFSVLIENEFSGCQGSGVLLEQGVLTACHVVSTDQEDCPVAPVLRCTTANGAEFLATVTRTDAGKDLALLSCRLERVDLAELGRSPEQDAPVVIVGSGFGRAHSVKHGTVANLEPGVLLLDARILPGDSGGAVLNQDDQLVGMVRAVSVEPPFVGYGIAVDADTLRAFLEK